MNPNETLKKRRFRLRPAHSITLSFLLMILIGAFFLSLPLSHTSREWLPFTDALFTSASAVCVTGLMTVPMGGFSIFGQVVILLLIQFGGLGFMTLTSMVFLLIRKRITLKERLMMRDALGRETHAGAVRMVKTIVILTFGIELIGALLLLPVFCVHYGASGIFKAVFTSVSSFCNAGFDIISLTHIAGSSAGWYISYVFVTLTLSALVVFGGLGFTVLVDILKQKRFKRLSLHSKVVLVMTGILILAPFLFLFGFEFNNADTVGNLSLGEKLLASLFYSINLRSSGFNYFDFNHIDFSAMTPQSRAFSMLFMFIGASPCSMGGGIKTTTFAVLILIFFSGGRQDNEITLGRHALHKKIGYRAVSVLLYFMFLILTMTILILIFEQDNISNGILNTEKVLFESISAACSVGFSLGITASLTTASKLVLAAGMYLGRIGAVTAGLMLFRPQEKTLIQYPEGHLMVG